MLADPPTPAELLANLREYREARGWLQKDLAAAAGVTQPAISLYETGKQTPNTKVFMRIVAAFGYHLTLSHDLVI